MDRGTVYKPFPLLFPGSNQNLTQQAGLRISRQGFRCQFSA